MSAYPVSDRNYPPVYSRTYDDFSSQIVLHADAANGGNAPNGVNWLPCQVIVETAGTESLVYRDLSGEDCTLTFPSAALTDPMRMAPATIETTTDVTAVTVFWSQKGG